MTCPSCIQLTRELQEAWERILRADALIREFEEDVKRDVTTLTPAQFRRMGEGLIPRLKKIVHVAEA